MQLLYLDPHQLELDPEGIREDAGDIGGLAQTIREQGLLQPLGVVSLGRDRYQVVYGGRRQRAAVELGLERVPCIVLDAADTDVLLQQLIENMQRQDLNDLEKARSFKRLRDRYVAEALNSPSEGELDERVGKAVGMAPRTVRRYLGLLDLPLEIQEFLRNGELSVTQAQHLRRISNTKTQLELAQMIVDEGLSAGEVSSLANYFSANPNLTVDAAMQALANNLELRTTPSTPAPEAGGPLPKGGTAERAESEDDFWADESESADEDVAFGAFAAEDENPSKNKARVFRIRSLDQMVDEADRLARAYHEGDIQKWVEKDEGASFKLRLLLKQLRTLTQALESLVGDPVDVE